MSRLTEYHCGVAVIKDKDKIKEAMAKLAEYEDLEEQGLLLRLPCKVGDTVYVILIRPSSKEYLIKESEVKDINVGGCNERKDIYIKIRVTSRDGAIYTYHPSEWGTGIFLTKEEAEAALEKMKSEV